MKKMLIALIFLIAVNANAGHQVIVNANSPLTTVSKKKLAAIFLKKALKWDDGSTATPVDLDDKEAARESFSKAVLGKSVAAVKSYWQQQIFSGRDVPPVEKPTEADIIAFVKANAGAVGYVSDTTAVPGVKVIKVQD